MLAASSQFRRFKMKYESLVRQDNFVFDKRFHIKQKMKLQHEGMNSQTFIDVWTDSDS